MKALLAGDLCGWPTDQVESLQDVSAPPELARQLVEMVKDVEDVLLLYYAGHGMRTTTGQLALALRESSANPELLPHTAIMYEAIARILRRCPAATKLVILDCCHAELGNKANYQFQSADIDGEPVDGLYFIGASKQYEKAKSPLAGGLPYFTEAFIQVVRTGIPGKPPQLTIDQIFTELRARMLRASLPEPVQSGIRDAHHWPFARNTARPETHRDPEREVVVLTQRIAELTAASDARIRAADAQIQALQAEAAELAEELDRLKAQASDTRDMTTNEQRELRSAIVTAERMLDNTVAAEEAARAAYPEPSSVVPEASAKPGRDRHRRRAEAPDGTTADENPAPDAVLDTGEAVTDAGDAAAEATDSLWFSPAKGNRNGKPDRSGQHQVTVVPGVLRYHDHNCILIRFMGDEDVQKMTLDEATQTGHSPCRACQPDANARLRM